MGDIADNFIPGEQALFRTRILTSAEKHLQVPPATATPSLLNPEPFVLFRRRNKESRGIRFCPSKSSYLPLVAGRF